MRNGSSEVRLIVLFRWKPANYGRRWSSASLKGQATGRINTARPTTRPIAAMTLFVEKWESSGGVSLVHARCPTGAGVIQRRLLPMAGCLFRVTVSYSVWMPTTARCCGHFSHPRCAAPTCRAMAQTWWPPMTRCLSPLAENALRWTHRPVSGARRCMRPRVETGAGSRRASRWKKEQEKGG